MPDEPIRILMVEDNPGDVRLIRKLLERTPLGPFQLSTVDRVAKAQALLSGKPAVDVLLLDVSLPGGFRALRRLTRSPKVVLVASRPPDELAAMAAGHLRPLGIPYDAEVVATAKRDLRPGDRIDGIGGSTVYGVADSADAVAAGGLLPLGLAARATVVRDVAIDQPLAYQDVELDESSTILQLRRLQDSMLGTGARG